MTPSDTAITTRERLLVHAMALESEAVDGYETLADQMEVHNNPEVAAFFRKMAEIEEKHLADVEQLCDDIELPHIPPWDMAWADDESPEGPKYHDDVHYLMTPYHAIEMAIRGEQRASEFFSKVADSQDAPDDVRRLARRFADDEAEHVRLLKQWLREHPEPDGDWHDDPDPPVLQA